MHITSMLSVKLRALKWLDIALYYYKNAVYAFCKNCISENADLLTKFENK